ncbi:MAG: hypothetical protein D3910_09675 [Candidatus Electrothrix sp. ATG2]|nr:hypothetical protein [Candidatus Electrothrix sp. ATG2]
MVIKKTPSLCLALTALVFGNQPVYADNARQNIISSTYDETAISSLLLAAGMYGGLNDDNTAPPGMSFSLSEEKDMLRGLFSNQGQFDGQKITLSYGSSEGQLGFSAGYIYTTGDKELSKGHGLLGLDNYSRNTLNNIEERPWYVTLDLSRSFQLNNNLAVGVGSKAVLLTNNLDREDTSDQAVSMSLNLPVSYKGFLTVTPELQWSRALITDGEQGTRNDMENFFDPEDKQNAFYGGMSITLSY